MTGFSNHKYDFISCNRIPLELFPIETQNKILEVEPVSETVPVEKYVDSSSFRFSPSRAQAAEESLR